MQATRRVSRADEMTEQSDRKLIATGIVGTVIAALCCFTPVLVVLLGAVGLSAWLGWLDYVLLPALAFFVAPVVDLVALVATFFTDAPAVLSEAEAQEREPGLRCRVIGFPRNRQAGDGSPAAGAVPAAEGRPRDGGGTVPA